ncbi:MAG: oligosaccharide flippase family protein [Chitinivibrionales bacterium]|nr:oligosaccharide flippase family protein [Chitinivibrionales bacterium]
MSQNTHYFDENRLKSELKHKTIRGAGATIMSRGFALFLHMFATIVLARLLVPRDFGIVSMVTAFSYLLHNVGLNGFTEAVIQEKHLSHGQVSTLFWIGSSVSILLAGGFVLLSPLLARFYDEPRLVGISMAFACGFIFSGLSTQHLALLKRTMQFGTVAIIEIIAMFVSITLAIGFALLNLGYWAIVVRQVSLSLIVLIGAWITCSWRPSVPAGLKEVGHMLRFAINTFTNFSVYYFSRNLDKILIGRFHGPLALGFYDRAYHLFVMPASQMTAPLTSVAIAALSRLREEPKRFINYYCKAISLLAFFGMLISGLLTLNAIDIILLLLGPQWDKTGVIFSVLSPATGIMLVYSTHGWLHLSLGTPHKWVRWTLVALVITLAGFLIGLPYGAIGVAAAYSITFYILVIPGILYAGRPMNIGIRLILKSIWHYFAACLLAGPGAWFVLKMVDFIARPYSAAALPVRILMASTVFILLYLLSVIVLHGSIRPLVEIFDVAKGMVIRKKQKAYP